jgi:hypothetical protein
MGRAARLFSQTRIVRQAKRWRFPLRYLDPSLPPEVRAKDLIARMTASEKVHQLTGVLANTLTGFSGELHAASLRAQLGKALAK